MSDRQTTVRLPDTLHERLRREVSISRTPANSIIIDAVRRALDERDSMRADAARRDPPSDVSWIEMEAGR